MQLMCIDWWFALTLLCWRGSFRFLCSKAIVSRIPTGGRYLWLHQIHRNSLKEGKKLASLTVSGFQSEAVGRLFCVRTCWDRSQGATSRVLELVWQSRCGLILLSHPADRYAAPLWSSEGNCVGSENNGSLGHMLRWSSFTGPRWVKLNKPASRSDFGWNKRDSTHFFFHRSQAQAWDKDIFTGLKRFIMAIYV